MELFFDNRRENYILSSSPIGGGERKREYKGNRKEKDISDEGSN